MSKRGNSEKPGTRRVAEVPSPSPSKNTNKRVSNSQGVSPANSQKDSSRHNSKPPQKTNNNGTNLVSNSQASGSSKTLSVKTKAKEQEPGTSNSQKDSSRHNSKPPPKTNNNGTKKLVSNSQTSGSSKTLSVKTKAKEQEPGTSSQADKSSGSSKKVAGRSRSISKKVAIIPLRMHATVPGLDTTKKGGAVPDGMNSCKVCGRNFTLERIEQHQQICKQTHNRNVKVFDSRKQRTQGTDLEPYIRRGTYKNNVQPPKNRWREKHEEFIRSIRYAKQTQAHVAAGGKITDLPPPPPSDYSDYIQCPYCKRKFSPEVAERHIPKCKNIISNKK